MKYLWLVLVLALTLSFTGTTHAYSKDPTLNQKVNYVFQDWDGDGKSWAWTVNNWDTEWKYGYVSDGKGGYYGGVMQCKYNGLFLGRCLFGYEVIILPNYGDELNVIAHEGSHVICAIWYADRSETCADNVARKYYPSYPY